jgi:hypothetical protein
MSTTDTAQQDFWPAWSYPVILVFDAALMTIFWSEEEYVAVWNNSWAMTSILASVTFVIIVALQMPLILTSGRPVTNLLGAVFDEYRGFIEGIITVVAITVCRFISIALMNSIHWPA